jgi:hypothetical protein
MGFGAFGGYLSVWKPLLVSILLAKCLIWGTKKCATRQPAWYFLHISQQGIDHGDTPSILTAIERHLQSQSNFKQWS